MKTTVLSLKTVLCAALIGLGYAQNLNAQTPALEFASGAGNPTGTGPSVTNQVITFQDNTDNPSGNTFASYTPTLTCTFSLSNQQYTLPTSQISTGVGLSFGADQNNSSATVANASLFGPMNFISSPSNNNFTSSTAVTAGTGIDISANRVVSMFTSARALYNASASTSSRYYFGDLTITFNQSVTNPIIQIVGLGGYYKTLGFTTELELQTSGILLSKLSGSSELSVSSGTKILNSSSDPGSATGSGAASGSVLATGSGITTMTFKIYMRGDGDESVWGSSSSHQGDVWLIGVSMNPPCTLSGNVYNDLDGLIDNTVDGTGIGSPSSTQLYANLLSAAGNVLSTVAVAGNGTYTFNRVASSTTYTVQVSSNQGTNGSAAPATALPSGWINTGENLGSAAGSDGTVNGKLSVAVVTSNVTNANFGIERVPDSDTKFYGISQPVVNASLALNGSGTAPGPMSGSDAEDGTLGSTKRVAITSLTTNGNQLWYNGVRITVGADGINPPSTSNPYIISSYSPALLAIKFTGIGSTQTVFNYAFYDAARSMDPTPATYTLTWAIPLPVKLISFTAGLENGEVAVRWTTATEINASHFVVERSLDGAHFTDIAVLSAAGNSSIKIDYYYMDKAVNANVVYYRLHSVDLDGRGDYSEVRMVKLVTPLIKSNITITAYPNPVSSNMQVTIPAAWQGKKILFELFNMNGQVTLRQEATSGHGLESLNMGGLQTGAYVLKLSCGDQSAKQAIIKN